MLALAGPVVFGALAAVSPAWAVADLQPAPPPDPAKPPPAAARSGPALDKPVPAVLLVSAVHVPADFVAPSYAEWLTEPPHDAPPGGWILAQRPATTETEIFQPVTIPSPPPRPSAAMSSALATSAVPLPPRRLVEAPRVVMAALVPLPPPRLLELPPAVPPSAPLALAMVEPPPVAALVPPAIMSVGPPPEEDAARTIDDGPEPAATRLTADRAPPRIEALIQRHADRFDVPASLIRRVAWRESKFDPSRRHGPYWGLMQIRVDTARGLGFRGAPADLLDAHTNMSYAVAYLANAYRVAGRDEKRAVMLYARGYYYEAKRKRMIDSLIRTVVAEKEPD